MSTTQINEKMVSDLKLLTKSDIATLANIFFLLVYSNVFDLSKVNSFLISFCLKLTLKYKGDYLSNFFIEKITWVYKKTQEMDIEVKIFSV